jgi:hypothetical protein
VTARPDAWEDLAARLVNAQLGGLANRVRRSAALVGHGLDWHERVLEEIGILHLLSQGGRRLGDLPDPLADAVATNVGWLVRTADVLAGVPETDTWIVAGRSDRREDRIEVRRVWLRGATSGRWALVLSFAAYQQSLDTSLPVGTMFDGDLHRYPGGALRALVGRRERDRPCAGVGSAGVASVSAGVDEIGAMLVAEPWLERVPATVRATPARSAGRWVLTDEHGSVPLHPDHGGGDRRAGPASALTMLVAVSSGDLVDVTIEWTPDGVIPLAVHTADRSIDIGPRADRTFVGAA